MAPTLVRGRITTTFQVVRGLSYVALVASLVLLWVDVRVASVVIPVCVAFVVAMEVTLAFRKHNQLWVVDTGDGFLLKDAHGERSFRDEDVFSVDFHTKKVYSQGVLKGQQRTFVVKLPDEARPVEMTNRIALGEVDPLGRLIERTIAIYRSQADEALRAGATVQGKGWSLSSDALTLNSKQPQTVLLSELGSVGEFDNQVCVWKKGGDHAVFKTPARSPNAYLLHLLLAQRLSEREDLEAGDTEGLGRILFERGGNRAVSFILWTVAGLALLIGFGCVVRGLARGDPTLAIVGVVLGLSATAAGYGGIVYRRSIFRCHERGVFKRGLSRTSQLRYEEVERFTYSATRQYYNGAYVGTSLHIRFEPAPGCGQRSIGLRRSVSNADDALDGLRDRVSALIAARMLRQLADGQRVAWTVNLALLPQGIEYRPSGLVGRKEPVVLPFQDVQGFNLEKGTFQLWDKNRKKPVVKEPASQANFFPGYLALCQLQASPYGRIESMS